MPWPRTIRSRRRFGFAADPEKAARQEKRWSTSMSYIVEKAVQPALDELEAATPPGDKDIDDAD